MKTSYNQGSSITKPWVWTALLFAVLTWGTAFGEDFTVGKVLKEYLVMDNSTEFVKNLSNYDNYGIYNIYARKEIINDQTVYIDFIDSVYLLPIEDLDPRFAYIWEEAYKNIKEGYILVPTGREYIFEDTEIQRIIENGAGSETPAGGEDQPPESIGSFGVLAGGSADYYFTSTSSSSGLFLDYSIITELEGRLNFSRSSGIRLRVGGLIQNLSRPAVSVAADYFISTKWMETLKLYGGFGIFPYFTLIGSMKPAYSMTGGILWDSFLGDDPFLSSLSLDFGVEADLLITTDDPLSLFGGFSTVIQYKGFLKIGYRFKI